MSVSTHDLFWRLLGFAGCMATGIVLSISVAAAQEPADDNPEAEEKALPVLQYIAPKSMEMLIGLKITAPAGNVLGTSAMTVFPTPWPEQKVEVLEIRIPPPFRHGFRDLPGGNKQLLLESQLIPANATVEATVRVRIEKSHIVGPEDTTEFVVPRRLPRDIRNYLGNSPYIETTATDVKKIVREIQNKEPLTEWKKIEMLYDWVRENISYETVISSLSGKR